jgi:hypothetical protein
VKTCYHRFVVWLIRSRRRCIKAHRRQLVGFVGSVLQTFIVIGNVCHEAWQRASAAMCEFVVFVNAIVLKVGDFCEFFDLVF